MLLANAPCTAQYRDGSTLVLEQIDVINRLIKKYPEELELVLTAQGILLLEVAFSVVILPVG